MFIIRFFRHALSTIEPLLLGHQRNSQSCVYLQLSEGVQMLEVEITYYNVWFYLDQLIHLHNHQLRCSQSTAKNEKTFIMQYVKILFFTCCLKYFLKKIHSVTSQALFTSNFPSLISLQNRLDPATLQRSPMFTNKVSGVIRPGSRPKQPIREEKRCIGQFKRWLDKKGLKVTIFEIENEPDRFIALPYGSSGIGLGLYGLTASAIALKKTFKMQLTGIPYI